MGCARIYVVKRYCILSLFAKKSYKKELLILSNLYEKALEAKQPYTIEMTLQEISQLFPGRRVRLDAYTRLTRYLATQQITLSLTSRKTKNSH